MNHLLKLTAAAAALAGLTACDALGLNRNESAGGNATGNVASNATADANGSAGAGGKDPVAGGNAATASAGFTGEVTHQFLVGRWTDNNDCNNTIEFKDDGSFTVPGGGSGIWALDGDRLTFQGGQGSRSARVQAPNPDTITLIHEDGSLGRSTRCTN